MNRREHDDHHDDQHGDDWFGHDSRSGNDGPPRDDGRPGGDDRPGLHAEEQHAGNGTVNHGPDDRSEESGADEQELRRLLQRAVQDIEPDDRTLDHLRRAVPARRARKRQALVGAAAAALLIGTAVPALVHVSNSGSSGDRTSVAGHGEDAHGGTGQGKGPDGGKKGSGDPAGSGKSKDKGNGHGKGGDSGQGTNGGATRGPDPSGTYSANSPTCMASALGDAVATVGGPDAEGKVYGTFKVANVSGRNCTVDDAGTVVTQAQGAADSSRITVVDHTAGDAATGLPDPSVQPSQLVLAPGKAYLVRFAWVPSESCPSGGDSSPDPTPSSGGGGNGSDQGSLSTQLYREEGPDDGSVAVSHTAEAGGPSAGTTIPNACAGTLYHTGVLPAQ